MRTLSGTHKISSPILVSHRCGQSCWQGVLLQILAPVEIDSFFFLKKKQNLALNVQIYCFYPSPSVNGLFLHYFWSIAQTLTGLPSTNALRHSQHRNSSWLLDIAGFREWGSGEPLCKKVEDMLPLHLPLLLSQKYCHTVFCVVLQGKLMKWGTDHLCCLGMLWDGAVQGRKLSPLSSCLLILLPRFQWVLPTPKVCDWVAGTVWRWSKANTRCLWWAMNCSVSPSCFLPGLERAVGRVWKVLRASPIHRYTRGQDLALKSSHRL